MLSRQRIDWGKWMHSTSLKSTFLVQNILTTCIKQQDDLVHLYSGVIPRAAAETMRDAILNTPEISVYRIDYLDVALVICLQHVEGGYYERFMHWGGSTRKVMRVFTQMLDVLAAHIGAGYFAFLKYNSLPGVISKSLKVCRMHKFKQSFDCYFYEPKIL